MMFRSTDLMLEVNEMYGSPAINTKGAKYADPLGYSEPNPWIKSQSELIEVQPDIVLEIQPSHSNNGHPFARPISL
jgi:hypothetical protein